MYGRYLLEVRALARPTIINYVPFIRSFLEGRFGSGRVTLSRLCASDVVRFVQRQAPRLHTKTAKLMTTALRSFLQYARYLGEVTLDLAAAVPIVANWSMTSIPRGDFRGARTPTPGQYRSSHRGRASRLCHLAHAGAIGVACRGSGISRTR